MSKTLRSGREIRNESAMEDLRGTQEEGAVGGTDNDERGEGNSANSTASDERAPEGVKRENLGQMSGDEVDQDGFGDVSSSEGDMRSGARRKKDLSKAKEDPLSRMRGLKEAKSLKEEYLSRARREQSMSVEQMKMQIAMLKAETEAEERKQQMRLAKQKAERDEDERRLRMRLDQEKADREKAAADRAEEERQQRMKIEMERAAREKAERQQRMKIEEERAAREKVAADRAEQREQAREDRENRQLDWEIQNESKKRQDKEQRLEREALLRIEVQPMKPGDDIDQYLLQFEEVMKTQKRQETQWADQLLPKVEGKTRDAVLSFLPAERSVWNNVKREILARHGVDADFYRRRFRYGKRRSDESYVVFAAKMELAAEKWMDYAGCDRKDAASLWKFIILEQFYLTLGEKQAKILREREPKSAKEAANILQRDWEDQMIAQSYAKGPWAKPGERRGNLNREQGGEHDNVNGRDRRETGQDLRGSAEDKDRDRRGNNVPQEQLPAGGGDRDGFRPERRFGGPRRCHVCGSRAHIKKDCPEAAKRRLPNFNAMAVQETLKEKVETPSKLCQECAELPVKVKVEAKVNGTTVLALRDTGADICCVQEELVAESDYIAQRVVVMLADGKRVEVPMAIVDVESPFVRGRMCVAVMAEQVYPLIVGNTATAMDGKRVKVPVYANVEMMAVQTRAQGKKAEQEQLVGSEKRQEPVQLMNWGSGPDEFEREQSQDATLRDLYKYAESGEQIKSKKGTVSYVIRKGILRRVYQGKSGRYEQVCVPQKFRKDVLKLAHDAPMSGHMGIGSTKRRIWEEFYWPAMPRDVVDYVRSCDACQRTEARGKTRKMLLQPMPLMDEPFSRVGIDLVGPIIPSSSTGKRYILVVVDHATRYPEAVPLRSMTARTVADALWDIWTRLGIPESILTDRGTQFTSKLMGEVLELLAVRGLRTTPYHAQCNGLVERFNGTLKTMLKRLAIEKPNTWDKFVTAALFAYREVPQASTGYSPFELMYGRKVRGPMTVLRSLWTQEQTGEQRETAAYVCELRDRIKETCELAKQNLSQSMAEQKRHFDKKASTRQIDAGDQVLVLLPEKHNKLELKWKGPFTVESKLGQCNYRIKLKKGPKILHGNLLKKYHARIPTVAALSVVSEEKEAEEPILGSVPLIPLASTEGPENVVLDETLSEKHEEVQNLLQRYPDVLTNLPGRCNLVECHITLKDEEPVRVKQYPLPHVQKGVVTKEVEDMLELKVIEPSTSPFTSPLVLVKKKDGSVRFCVDFRALNRKVIFDGEPIPNVDQLFAQIGQCKFLTKLDLTKGYWQIPIVESDRSKTAFATQDGLFQWTVLPFGLSTSGAIFSRMMRLLLAPLKMPEITNFIDDVLIATDTWERHVQCLTALLDRIREAGLTVKPSKCLIAHRKLPYLGYVVGESQIGPEEEKVRKIQETPRPVTRKQLRSFLGLIGFYRRFCPNFATIALPLTDATKKREPSKIQWNDEREDAFVKLKNMVCSDTVCVLPNDALPFVLRTDASGSGLGAVLMQDHGAGLQPIAFASKKLLAAELNYATVEKECYAIVWGIKRFEPYLFGRHFTVQTDHCPLAQLKKLSPANGRLMRWSLQLQEYTFDVQTIPGKENVDADFLSRQHEEEGDAHSDGVEIVEKTGNLFCEPTTTSIAHCVSRDFAMAAGIAKQFADRFGRVSELRRQRRRVGQAAVLKDGERWLYYLVTKDKFWEKPTYDMLRSSIQDMCRHALLHDVRTIAVPKLGCGLDDLHWAKVKTILKEECSGMLSRVIVCIL